MKHTGLLIFVFFALFGCTKVDVTDSSLVLEAQQQQNILSLDDARTQVESLVTQIDKTTRASGMQRKIVDYYCVGKRNATRSEASSGQDLLTYVFNFEGDSGYAIVVADNRVLSPILTLTDSGYLDPNKAIDDQGLITFLAMSENYVNTEIQNYERKEIGGTIEIVPIDQFTTLIVKERVGRRTYLNWDQRTPFNDNITLINGQRPPLGCTATATMLLMAWYQYPQVYDRHIYNWKEMLKHKNEKTNGNSENRLAYSDLAKLSEIITRPENLDMTFGLSGSGAFENNIPRTLKRLGYFHGGTYADWNEDVALAELRTYPHYPVVVAAYALQTNTTSGSILGIQVAPSGYTSGHTFLLEGACIGESMIKLPTGMVLAKPLKLVYVNYGWNGSSNGYYNAGVFNTVKGPVIQSTAGTDGYYQYDIDMIYGVRI